MTGRAGGNGQYSEAGAAAHPWTRPSAPECGDTLKDLASFGLILGGNLGNLAPGSSNCLHHTCPCRSPASFFYVSCMDFSMTDFFAIFRVNRLSLLFK